MPSFSNPIQNKAILLRVRDPNLIPFTSSLFQTLEMDPKRRGTPAYSRNYDSEYQRPRKFQRTNPYNQDQVNLCDVEKTLWRLYTRSFYTSIIMYVRKFPFYTMYLPDSNVTLPTSNPVCTASTTSVFCQTVQPSTSLICTVSDIESFMEI